jgi:hypothetical protein
VSAFAVTDPRGFIIVETVGPTERSAMVNWLVVGAGIMVTNSWSDERIKAAFEGAAAQRGVQLIPVQILGEHALPPGAVQIIIALLEKLGGSAFVHDSEIAELRPEWRFNMRRELFPQDGVLLEIDKGGPADPNKVTILLGGQQ